MTVFLTCVARQRSPFNNKSDTRVGAYTRAQTPPTKTRKDAVARIQPRRLRATAPSWLFKVFILPGSLWRTKTASTREEEKRRRRRPHGIKSDAPRHNVRLAFFAALSFLRFVAKQKKSQKRQKSQKSQTRQCAPNKRRVSQRCRSVVQSDWR